MKRSLTSILPGFLFALAAPVVFYAVNPDNRIYMSLQETQRSVFFCLGCFVLFFLLALWISRNVEAAGLMAAVLVLGAFYLWQIALIVVAAPVLLVVLLKVLRKKIHFAQFNLSLQDITDQIGSTCTVQAGP